MRPLVTEVVIPIDGRSTSVKHFTVFLPVEDKDLIQLIRDRNPSAVIDGVDPGLNWLPFVLTYLSILILGAWMFRGLLKP